MRTTRYRAENAVKHAERRDECGGAECVASLLRHYGLAADVKFVPASLLDLRIALEDLGLSVTALRGTIPGLRTIAPPAVLLLDGPAGSTRFAVYVGFDGKKYYLEEAGRPAQAYSAARLVRRWTSTALLQVEPRSEGLDRFRAADLKFIAFGSDRVAVRRGRTGQTRVVVHEDLNVIFSADEFRSRDALESRLFAAIGKDSAAMIDRCLKAGLLESEKEAVEEVLRCCADSGDSSTCQNAQEITSVGIPTRERTPEAAQSARAILLEARECERTVTVRLADGSGVSGQMRLSLELARLAREFGAELHHLDDGWRANAVRVIQDELACDPSTLRFALFGHEGASTNYGANRNALLLASAGEVTLQIDDDVRMPLLESPLRQKRLIVSSRPDPQQYWFGRTAMESLPVSEKGLLQAHQRLLGRRLCDVISSYERYAVSVDTPVDDVMHALAAPDARVAVTTLGHVGDSGASSNTSRLTLTGLSQWRLLSGEYDVNMRGRDIVRSIECDTVGRSLFCMGMNLGLDHRIELPPFMPSGRNEDGVFGAVVHACFPTYVRGFVGGLLVQHRPPEERGPYEGPVRFTGMRVNDMLIALIQYFTESRPPAMRRGTRWLGELLCDAASVGQPEFDELCRDLACRSVGMLVRQVEESVRVTRSMSNAMMEDARSFVESAEEYVESISCGMPVDVPGCISDRFDMTRSIAFRYGKLLIDWPDIVRVAREMRLDRVGFVSKGTGG